MGFTFETETLHGSFDSTIAAGMGLRTESRGFNLINQGPTRHNVPPTAWRKAQEWLIRGT